MVGSSTFKTDPSPSTTKAPSITTPPSSVSETPSSVDTVSTSAPLLTFITPPLATFIFPSMTTLHPSPSTDTVEASSISIVLPLATKNCALAFLSAALAMNEARAASYIQVNLALSVPVHAVISISRLSIALDIPMTFIAKYLALASVENPLFATDVAIDPSPSRFAISLP